jgi:hypothetical protein
MDPMSPVSAPRPDIVAVESTPRPTARPARVAFGDVLAAGASGFAQGAQLAVSALPGSAVTAAAVRGGGSPSSVMGAPVGTASVSPEGPGVSGGGVSALGLGSATTAGGGLPLGGAGLGGVAGTGTGSTDGTGTIEQSLAQSANLNIYYLQLQEQEDAQNRAFTAQSNILKTEHDGCKNAIGNIHS